MPGVKKRYIRSTTCLSWFYLCIVSTGASVQSSRLTVGLADLRSALSVGFHGCSVGKNQSEHLRSRLANGVALYRSVLRGR